MNSTILFCYPKYSSFDSKKLLNIMHKLYLNNDVILVGRCLCEKKDFYIVISGVKNFSVHPYLEQFFEISFLEEKDRLPYLEIL